MKTMTVHFGPSELLAHAVSDAIIVSAGPRGFGSLYAAGIYHAHRRSEVRNDSRAVLEHLRHCHM
jgi:hypothetical protein